MANSGKSAAIALAAVSLSCGVHEGEAAGARGLVDRLLAPFVSSTPESPSAPPAPEPAASPAPEPIARPARDEAPLQHAMATPKYAGGRPIAWWSERLVRLRREGPEELYVLTRERARLNGLVVVEGEGHAVEVALSPGSAGRP